MAAPFGAKSSVAGPRHAKRLLLGTAYPVSEDIMAFIPSLAIETGSQALGPKKRALGLFDSQS